MAGEFVILLECLTSQGTVTLINNGYPEAIINTVMTKKMNQFRRPTQFGPKKCPVYLHLPWLGNVSLKYETQTKTAVKRCYFAVEPCIVYTTRQLLPVAKKDVLPAFHQSNIVYQFLCHCDSQYVGRTSQRLQQRIKQHDSPEAYFSGPKHIGPLLQANQKL